MLSNNNRLRADSDFKRVKDEGLLFQGENFAVAVLDRGDGQDSRFGFVVSTKISKSAVARNAVKRNLRSAVTEILPKVKRGVDIVFLVKPTIIGKSSGEIQSETERIMKSADLLT